MSNLSNSPPLKMAQTTKNKIALTKEISSMQMSRDSGSLTRDSRNHQTLPVNTESKTKLTY